MSDISASGQGLHVSEQEILGALQRVLESQTFSHSVTLRHALEFLVRTNLASPGECIKEYSVATEAFGRGSDFDPKTDNVVRVQMHRLREKLEDYYQVEGQEEQIRIRVPRGHYNPEYARNSEPTEPATARASQAAAFNASLKRKRSIVWIAIVALAASNAFFAVRLYLNEGSRRTVTLSPPLLSLWQPFLSSTKPPLIVFANPAFLVDKEGDLYRYDSPGVISMAMGTRVPALSDPNGPLDGKTEDGPFYYFDSYTGSGELVAASRVSRFVTLHGGNFMVERSGIASDEEILRNNVIFLGGNKEDDILRKLPFSLELVFEPPPPGEYPIGSYIEDRDPAAGQPRTYHLQLDPATGAIQVEYALISLIPNVSPDHYVLNVGGLTTLGTQAAAKFVTSAQDMAILEQMRVRAGKSKADSPFFQALLEVNVRDGVPLNAKCILVHNLK